MRASVAEIIPALSASFRLDVRGLDDRCPAGNLALDQSGERLLAAPGLVGNDAAEVEQPLARAFIVQRLVERVAELVEDWLWRALGGEQGVPRRRLELRQPRLARGRHVGESRIAFGGANRIGLDRAALHLRHDVDDLVA